MVKNIRFFFVVLPLILMVVLAGVKPAFAALPSPANIISGLLSSVLSVLWKKLWVLSSITQNVVSRRPMVKFETGYNVETVFDGSKLGIEPHSVEVHPDGDLLVMDSVNSVIYRISPPLSKYSRPKLLTGSAEGYPGYVDGKLKEARMNHPTGFAVDDRGNIYVADTMNMAIRKINDKGVTTITGGKRSSGGHMDGPSEDSKLSNDFQLVYIGRSCTLLVVDRGYHAIREIQLHVDDCSDQYQSGITLGIIGLCLAGFFGYMIALLQHRPKGSSKAEPETLTKSSRPRSSHQKPSKSSVRPPLVPIEDDESPAQEEGGLFNLVWNFFSLFCKYRQKKDRCQQQGSNSWPVEESFIISKEDQPPLVEPLTPTPRKTNAFMSMNPQKLEHLKQNQAYLGDCNDELRKRQHIQQHIQCPSRPRTYYDQNAKIAEDIVFGAIQE